ncbi:recombinase family protein [bacterium]|nr:recombinase family protein [bacterium]
MQEIAAETVSSWKTVRRNLLYMKISLKPVDRLIKEPERFGMRRVAGELVEDPNEQSAIEKIKTLRADGQSIRDIVKILNQEKVPTRCIGAKWHIKTVFDISKR